MTLGDAARKGRDNNFNLIRMLAAIAVLISHAWPLTLGPEVLQPLQALTGDTLGTHAVHVFFLISGLLIAASFERRRSLASFVTARARRLFPGIIVASLLVTLVLGPAVTALPWDAYFAQGQTWRFLLGNSLIVLPSYVLPGVFETNPFPEVQGSIWTLRYELACYVLLMVVGICGLLRPWLLLTGMPLVYAAGWFILHRTGIEAHPILPALLRLSFPFMLGAAIWHWRDHIPLSPVLPLATGALAILVSGTPAAWLAMMMFMAAATFWLAYVPVRALGWYNRLGDYSYGVYVYAFPVQGLVVWLFGATSPALHSVLALPLTLILAVLSWHLIEKPMLRR